MKTKTSLFAAALIALVLLPGSSVWAQAYPTRPVEIVCTNTPGTSVDIMARLIADLGSKYLGQPMVVTNKPGGVGAVAVADVVAAKPDGYKLLQAPQDFWATTIHTLEKVPFDPNDMAPLANFVALKFGLGVRADSPIKNFKDFVDYTRKHPGQVKWAHTGRGTPSHMPLLVVLKQEGLTAIDIPFKGTPEIIAALLGGHVDMASTVYGAVVDQIRAGKIRLLAIYDEKRSNKFPDTPSIAELGYPKAAMVGLVGLYLHKNTPDPIKKKLLEVCKKVADDPEFKKGIEKINAEVLFGDPEFLKEAIKKTAEVQVPIIRELGLYITK